MHEQKVNVPGNSTPEHPTRVEIDEILGKGEALLDTFLERNPEFRPAWSYYGPKNGWSLKLFRKKRNMCFVGREPGAIAMGFVLVERAYDHLLTLDLRPTLRETVEGGKRFPEGRGIRLILNNESDLEDAQLLLEVKGST